MSRVFRTTFAIIAICANAAAATAQYGLSNSSLVTAGSSQAAVVSGEVIMVKQFVKNKGAQGVVKITRVHSGPKSLEGLAFFEHTAEEGELFSDNGTAAVPLLKVGETGIWTLRVELNSGRWMSTARYRKDETPNYDRRVEWADAIGRLTKLNVPERLKAAKELCRHKTPEVAELGVEVVLSAKPDDAHFADVSEFVEGLPKNRDITFAALTRADFLLFDRDGKKWVESDRRKPLLDRLTEPLTAAEATVVVAHVTGSQGYQGPHGTWLTAAEASIILTKLATDQKQPKAVRTAVINQLIEKRTPAVYIFDVFAAVIRKGDDDHRLPTARGIATHRWKQMAQQDELRALLKDEKNEKVAEVLAFALRESTKPDR